MTQTAPAASRDALQDLCEQGSEHLIRTEYLQAERALAAAEEIAWVRRDWDTLSRLYMPLQETRRQRRQRCGEGIVCLDLAADGPDDPIDAERIINDYPHGQLLVAGWASLAPAVRVRALAAERSLYAEVFLAASYPVVGSDSPLIAILAREDTQLPQPTPRTKQELMALLPAGSLVVSADDLPPGETPGDTRTYADVMAVWEKLHRPLLDAADQIADPLQRMEAYRKVIRVDYACELAHQKLSAVAAGIMEEKA
jgi:hypothetical protein